MDRQDLAAILGFPTIGAGLDQVDRQMDIAAAGELSGFLRRAIAPGKRLRPALLIAAAANTKPATIRAAAAVELVHQASKLHDDIMDQDAKDNYKNLLGGDLLLAAGLSLAAASGAWAAAQIAGAISQMVQGQYLQSLETNPHDPASPSYIRICGLKTASLFEAAASIGGRLGGLDTASAGHLGDFGREFGQAFQIIDDIADNEFTKNQLPAARRLAKLHLLAAKAAAKKQPQRAGPLISLAGWGLDNLPGSA